MSSTKVTLRKRELKSGKITLYLDYYPPVRNPRTMEMSRREYLGMYLIKNPRTPFEKSQNAEKLAQAEAIRSHRELSIVNGQYGFMDKTKQKMDFLQYFQCKMQDKPEKWFIVYNHFSKYVKGTCTFADITTDICNGFRTYLLNAKQLSHTDKTICQNSASTYWSTFRALLAIAYKEKFLQEDINDYLEKIDPQDTRRQFLTMEEVQSLAKTECIYPVLKSASLFSCLTGLRISDILALKWENFETYTDGGHCIRIRTEKTDTETLNPISDEAFNLCGTPDTGIVFKGLRRTMLSAPLQKWIKSAGIAKHITFHCLRHRILSFAL